MRAPADSTTGWDPPSVLQDRSLAADVTHVALCPRMDILALVLDGKTISLHRLNWQRLASFSVSSDTSAVVTTITWSPDGASIAAGMDNGDLSLFSVDRAASTAAMKTKRAAKEATAAVALKKLPYAPESMHWIESDFAPSNQHDPTALSSYEDRAAMQPAGSSLSTRPATDGLLAIGDADGVVSLMAFDLKFVVAKVRVLPSGCPVSRIFVTKGLECCLAVGAPTQKTESKQSTQVYVRTVELSSIKSFWPELCRAGIEMVAVNSFRSQLGELSQVLKEHWSDGAMDVINGTIRDALMKLMGDFAENNSDCGPWEALQEVFCGGRMSGAVLQFLAADLTENGAKDSLRVLRAKVDLVGEALMTALPLAENMVFRASEYRGLARLRSRFAKVGISFATADRMFAVAEAILMELSNLARRMEQTYTEAEAFLEWLVKAAARAGGETIQGQGSSMAQTIDGRGARLVSEFFLNVITARGAAADDAVTEAFKNRFTPAVERFQYVADEIEASTLETASSTLAVKPGLNLTMTVCESEMQSASIEQRFKSSSNSACFLDMCMVTAQGRVVIAKHNSVTGQWFLFHKVLGTASSTVVGAALYTDSSLVYVTNASTQSTQMSDSATPRVACHLRVRSTKDMGDGFAIDGSRIDDEHVAVELPEAECVDGADIVDVEYTSPPSAPSESLLLVNENRKLARYGHLLLHFCLAHTLAFFLSYSNTLSSN